MAAETPTIEDDRAVFEQLLKIKCLEIPLVNGVIRLDEKETAELKSALSIIIQRRIIGKMDHNYHSALEEQAEV